jgi:alkyl hydroperoxide reductase subunit AhpC
MSLINTQVQPFKAQAFRNGKFEEVTEKNLSDGKNWSVVIFMPAAFTFVHIDEEGLALRGTFVIDPSGTIKTMEVHSNEIARDVTETVRKLKAAQYTAAHPGEVCPAKWKEGAKTLTPSIDLVGKI